MLSRCAQCGGWIISGYYIGDLTGPLCTCGYQGPVYPSRWETVYQTIPNYQPPPNPALPAKEPNTVKAIEVTSFSLGINDGVGRIILEVPAEYIHKLWKDGVYDKSILVTFRKEYGIDG